MKRTIAITSLLAALWAPPALGADVDAGLAWLAEARAPEGALGVYTARGTALTLATYDALGMEPDAAAAEALYLAAIRPEGHDAAAWRLMGLRAAGSLDVDAAEVLLAAQNDDGGWGPLPGWASSVPETVRALSALAGGGVASAPALSEGAAWLALQQDDTGGFAFEGNAPSVTLTAEALMALSAAGSQPTAVADASGWLLAQQGDDGAFGEGADAALLTAQALWALSDDASASEAWAEGAAALDALQLEDGSWEGDAVATAAALRALGFDRPNLKALSIAVIGDGGAEPVEGEPAAVTITVTNTGRRAAGVDSAVALYLYQGSDAEPVPIGAASLSPLAAGASTDLTVAWDTTGHAGHLYLLAEVDPADAVGETREDDNRYVGATYLIPRVDLEITAADLSADPDFPGVGEDVTLTATVHNRGGTDAEDVVVAFYDGDPQDGGSLLAEETVPSMPAFTDAAVAYTAGYDTGAHPIFVVVDPGDDVAESLEGNNVAAITVEVTERFDFASSYERIQVSDAEPVEGQVVTVQAVILNLREDDAEDVPVRLSVYNTTLHADEGERVAIGDDVIIPTLVGGGSATVRFDLPTQGWQGKNYVYVEADPDDAFTEVREDNNQAIVTVKVQKPANVYVESISRSPSTPIEGQEVRFYARIGNNGGVEHAQVPVRFKLGDPGEAGIDIPPVVTSTLLKIGEVESTTNVYWDSTGQDAGEVTVYAIIDPDNLITEVDEADNVFATTFTLNGRTNLIFEGLSLDPPEPEDGDAVTVTLTVANTEATATTETFVVQLFDGDPSAGGLQIGGDVQLDGLGANATQEVAIPWSTLHAQGDHTLFAVVDPAGVVDERYTADNTFSQAVTVAAPTRPELRIAADELLASARRGVSPGETLTYTLPVHNDRDIAAEGVLAHVEASDIPLATGGPTDLAGLATEHIPLAWVTPATLLNTTLVFRADPLDAFAEANEDDNHFSLAYKSRLAAGTEPTGLVAELDYHSVDLSWQASPAADIVGYWVWRGDVRANVDAQLPPLSVEASSESNTTSRGKNNAIDDDSSTYWRSGGAAPQWLEVRLEDVQAATGVDIHWDLNYRGIDYELQGWDGAAWQTLLTVTDNGDERVSHEATRYLSSDRFRVYSTRGAASALGIREIDIVGFDPALDLAFTDVDAPAGDYDYTVTAVASNTHESPDSGAAQVVISPVGAPGGLLAEADYTRVDLSWDAVEDGGLVSYLVYRDGELVHDRSSVDSGELTASGSYNTSYVPERAHDDDLSTYWRSPTAKPWYLTWAFDEITLVGGASVRWHGSYRGVDYFFEAWDGDAWHTLLEVTGNTTSVVSHTFDQPIPTQMLRLNITASTSSTVAVYDLAIEEIAKITPPSYADSHLKSGGYDFEVRGINRLWEIGAAAQASATVPAPIPPAALAVSPGINTATLNWPAVDNDALASYLVSRDGILVDESVALHGGGDLSASASSTYSGSYIATEAIDGDSGYWRSATNVFPNTWEASFAEMKVLTHLELDWHNSYSPIDFDVQLFDGKYWRTVDAVEGNTSGYTRHRLESPFATTRMRVVSYSSESSTVGLVEAYFYGFAARTGLSLVEGDVPSGERVYDISVLDIVGEISAAREAGGTLPLPAPSGLVAEVDGDNVELSWSLAEGDGIVGYRVTRDGIPLGGRDPDVNLTGSGTLSASSQSSSSYSPDKAGDGSTSTRWIGAGDLPWYWIQLDLPRPVEIASVQCAWYSGERGIDYQIQTLEGGVWVTRRTVVGNTTNTFTHGLDQTVSTTAVRVFITEHNGRSPGLYELRVYPRAAADGPTFVDRGVDGGSHLYGVQAQDALGGVSAMITAVAELPEIVAPTLTRAEAIGSDVALEWSASPTAGVVGYRVYRDDVIVGEEAAIAAAATASSSTNYSTSSSYQPSNALDGSTSTRWRSSSGSGDKILTLTWPEPHKISDMRLVFGSSTYPTDYRIEAWTGSEWYVEYARAGSTFSSVTLNLNNVITTDQIRFVATGLNSSYVEVYEIEASEHIPEAGLSLTDSLVTDGHYRYCVKAVTADFLSPCSAIRAVDLVDELPPAQPTGLVISEYTNAHITLAWEAAEEADIYGYNVYYDGASIPLNSLPVPGPTYRHNSVINRDDVTYTYAIEPVDINGNVGPLSAPVTFAPEPLDGPTGLAGEALGQAVNLVWEAHPDPLTRSYTVYRDGAIVGDHITEPAFTDPLVPTGEHDFAVATRDLFGRLGAPSDAITVTLSDLDLAASSSSIFFQPQSPSELDDLALKASFTNEGDDTTPSVPVAFYDGDPDAGGVLLGTGTLPSLGPDQIGVAEITWVLAGQAGTHTIYAVVDPADAVLEFYETNNVATETLEVTEVPELVVEVGGIDASNFPEIVATVGVVTPQGQPVAGLRPQNFMLLEDDIAQGPLTVVETSQLGEVAPLTVDIVVLVDASGSMDSEWVKIPEIVDDLGDALYVRGIDARIVKLSLASSVSGYEPLSTAVFDGVEYALNCGVPCTEDWAPGTTYLAQSFDWREGAVRVIVPAADEDAYHGDPETDEDLRAVNEAGQACQDNGVLAFPLWGDGSADTVIRQMHDLADLVGAEAFYYEDADLIVPYMTDAIEAQFAQYEVSWVTLNDLPDGTERLVDLTARYRGAEGEDSGSYVAPGLSRLDLVATDLSLDPPAPIAGEGVTLTGTLLSRSTVSVSGVAAQIFLEDGLGARLPLGSLAALGELSPGQSETFSVSWDAAPGPWVLVAEADPEDRIDEEDEANNRFEAAVDIPGAPAYELAIPEGGVSVSPLRPVAGDHAEVTVVVQNLGRPVSGALLALYEGDPAEGALVSPSVELATLARGEQVEVVFEWDTEGQGGEAALTAWVDPGDVIAEVNEANNRRELGLLVGVSPYDVSVAADAQSYGAGEEARFTATVLNRDGAPFSGEVRFALTDADGGLATELGTLAVDELPAAPSEDSPSTVDVTLPWNVGATLAGDYLIVATLTQGDDRRAEAFDAFTVTAQTSLSAEVATDHAAYEPWERVFVDADLINTSPNGIAAPTHGVLTLIDPQGAAVASAEYGVLALAPGGELSFSEDFPLTEAEPGTWQVELVGMVDGEAVATARAFFDILGTGGNPRSLFGALEVVPNQALVGEALAAAWSLENRGNEAMVGVPVSLVVANAETGAIAAESSLETVTLAAAASADGSGAIDTTDLGVGAWQAHLMVEIEGEATSVASARFSLVNVIGSLAVEPEVAEGGVDSLSLGWTVTNRSDGPLPGLPLAITVTSDDDGIERARFDFSVDLDASADAEGEESQASADLALGAHTARLVTVVDGGDLPIAETGFEVVDTLAPTTELSWVGTLVDDDDGKHYAPSATRYILQAADGFAGVERIDWAADGAAAAPYEGPIALVEGAHTLSFFAVDRAGNQEAPGSFAVTTDDSPPVITVAVLDEGGCLKPGDALSFSLDDLSPAEATATLDGEPFASGDAVTGDGAHTLIVTAIDILGHEAQREEAFELSSDACACAEGDAIADADGDGIPTCGGDCDDDDAASFPGAVEICDGADNNCDGSVDEDEDGDGFDACADCDEGDAQVNPDAIEVVGGVDDDCDGAIDEGLCLTDDDGDGVTALGGDCDDDDDDVHPGATEIADGVDDDCDGAIDEGTIYVDDDGDGFTDADGDCDDTNAAVHPDAEEAIDGVDTNCDGQLEAGAVDADGDGVSPSAGDCDDGDAAVSPRAEETANGADDDCDDAVDEGTDAGDDDGDGLSEDEGDCDDADANISPDAQEAEDGRDGDCDGEVDEGFRPCDLDGDGVTELEGDCDDTNANISPDAPEVCGPDGDPADEDCDDAVDEGGICDEGDEDADGYTASQGDCDDTDASVHPGATEVCDGVDQDCDDNIDEGLTTTTQWVDGDGDGFGEGDQDAEGVELCEADAEGYAPLPGDCDDGDASVNPDAGETCGNGVDDNCDGAVDDACVEATPTVEPGGGGCDCKTDPSGRGSLPIAGALLLLAGVWLRRRSHRG